MPKIEDPSAVPNLNAASERAAINAVVAGVDGPDQIHAALTRALDLASNSHEHNVLIEAFCKAFRYGRITAMRAAYTQKRRAHDKRVAGADLIS